MVHGCTDALLFRQICGDEAAKLHPDGTRVGMSMCTGLLHDHKNHAHVVLDAVDTELIGDTTDS
jgi:hypothetical protein